MDTIHYWNPKCPSTGKWAYCGISIEANPRISDKKIELLIYIAWVNFSDS